MSYIEDLAPRGYDPYTLFVYPFEEGIRNIRHSSKGASLCGRVTRCCVGLLLLIPLINTIVFLILRDCRPILIFQDRYRVLPTQNPDINSLNQARNASIISGNYAALGPLEAQAASHMTFQYPGAVRRHLQQQSDVASRFLGGISYTSRAYQLNAQFIQQPGLQQDEGVNQLCGYYALFFMYQATTDKHFTNRTLFTPKLQQWLRWIAEKRATAWCGAHRDQDMPGGMEIAVGGLSRDDIKHLIQKDDDLHQLARQNCFIMETDEWYARRSESYVQPLTYLGNGEAPPLQFPLYCILKHSGHYYFTWAETPWQFRVIHSTQSQIQSTNFPYRSIVYCLKQCLLSQTVS